MERLVIYVLIVAALVLVGVFGQEWLRGYFASLTPAP